MKLGFFTMPIHPVEKDWRQSLREDREAFLLADEVVLKVGLVGDEPAQHGVPDGGVRQPAGFERTREVGHDELPAIDAVYPQGVRSAVTP